MTRSLEESAIASAEKSIDMLEDKCLYLKDIISAKDRKIIALFEMGIKYTLKDVNAVAMERGGNAPYTIEEARQIAHNKNGQCLSEKYVNSSSSLLWKCAKSHEWYKLLYRVKNHDTWCPEYHKISQNLEPARDFAL
ncbi:13881_t:CDS:2, partial [Funneliformis geosporum]